MTPDASSKQQTTLSRVTALDGVRGLAILAVIGVHMVPEVAPGGSVGVDLFFTLSAFLISSLLLAEHASAGRIDLRAFYWRRGARLLPALLIFLVAVAPPVALAFGTGGSVPLDSAIVLGYLSDFGKAGFLPFTTPYEHAWSLAVEEQFYLLWPAVLMLVLAARANLLRWACILWVAGVVVFVVGDRALGAGENYFLPTGHLASLAAGVAAAFVLRRTTPQAASGLLDDAAMETRARWWEHPTWALSGLAALAFFALDGRGDWSVGATEAADVAGTLLLALLVLYAATATGFAARCLSFGPLAWLGTRSYGIYLYHLPIFYLLTSPRFGLPRAVESALALALFLSLAELSFRYVERPVLRWSRTWDHRPGARDGGQLVPQPTVVPEVAQ